MKDMGPATERHMVDRALAYLSSLGLAFATEVPFLHRSIDLVFETIDGSLVAVEFKKSDWRRALEQAYDHRLGTDTAYISFPAERISEGLLRSAEEIGVGVFAWTPDLPLEEVLSPGLDAGFSADVLRGWLKDHFQLRRNAVQAPADL